MTIPVAPFAIVKVIRVRSARIDVPAAAMLAYIAMLISFTVIEAPLEFVNPLLVVKLWVFPTVAGVVYD